MKAGIKMSIIIVMSGFLTFCALAGLVAAAELPLPANGSLKASDPTPPDGAEGVISPLLEWTSGETATWHDVYLGTNPTPGAAEYKGRQPVAWNMWFEVGDWVSGTTYYWRIDEVEADGTTIHTGDVWSFTAPSLTAYDPDPPDGAEGVISALLEWESGETAKFHDIYLGTNPTPGAAEFKMRQPLAWNMYFHQDPLIPGATYYWRIDEVEADGTTIHTGDVWRFTVAPRTAYNPDPPDGAMYVETDVDLSWSKGPTAVTHDVYFGTDETEVANGAGGTFKGNQSARTYDPGTLAIGTTYYWRIDEIDGDGTKHVGDVWSFTTISPGPAELEITGPDEVFEQSSARYNAVAYYADGSTKDVTAEAIWSVHSPSCASIDENGFLTTEAIDEAKAITVYAAYTEGEVTVHAEKAVWCVPHIVEAKTFYVDAVKGSDLNDGLTPETAFATIQRGVDSGVDGDTVIVADGTYTGQGNRDINLKGKAITLRSENGAANCGIDCMRAGRGFYFGHNEDADTVVEGFTIIYGWADNGGGVYCSSSPTISHCIIRLNEAKHGAGVAIQDFAEPTIDNCLICENSCTGFGGGGIDCHNASPTIINCTIADNSTEGEGGAITARGNSYPILTNCILWADTPYETSLAGGASASVTYCDVQGGWSGEGNIDADPHFVEIGEELVSHWTFDEGEGNMAFDSAGTNDGIIHGAQWATGEVGAALNFDGFLDCVALADESLDDLGSNVTFSAWVCRNRTFPSGQEVIFSYSDSASDHWYLYFSLSWDVVTYYCRKGRGSGDDCLYLGSAPIDEGQWYHLVVVVNGTRTRAYINGQREDFTKQPAAECAGAYCFPEIRGEAEKARIGILTRLTGEYDDFDGRIDELMIFNRALSAPEVQQLYQDSLASPVAHWKFDEAEGEIAYDSVGDNHGTIHGARWTAGQIEGALDFDGVDDYVEVEDPLDIALETNYSVSAWVNIHNILPTYGVVAAYRHQSSPSVVFQLDRAAADVRFAVRDDAGNIAIATGFEALAQDSWHHIAGVRRGDDLSIYINGEEGTSSSNTFGQMIPNDLKIGAIECCELGVHHHFNGSIDDVRIYDQAFSGEEVQSLYQRGSGSKRADYRLSANSPCIDAGDPDYVSWQNDEDLNGNPRVTGDAIDMGAFESQPLIEVHADKFLFEGVVGYPNPPDQILLLHNAGAGTLNWQISCDCSWLQVDPNSGTSKGYGNTVWLRVDTTGLAAGEYDCELTIWAPFVTNSPHIVKVSLIVRKNRFPDTPDYAQQYADFLQYVAHGADPSCWCASLWDGTHYQCDGDASGKHQTFTKYRVYGDDLALLINNWKRKIDTADPCADFDHKAESFLNYRVYGNDLAILIANWKKRDADLPGDCPRPDGQ